MFINKPINPLRSQKGWWLPWENTWSWLSWLLSFLGPCSIYVTPFAVALCLINVLARLISSHLHAIMSQIYNTGSILYCLTVQCPLATWTRYPYSFTPYSIRLCHVPMACTTIFW
jgi:hypothetical protein